MYLEYTVATVVGTPVPLCDIIIGYYTYSETNMREFADSANATSENRQDRQKEKEAEVETETQIKKYQLYFWVYVSLGFAALLYKTVHRCRPACSTRRKKKDSNFKLQAPVLMPMTNLLYAVSLP